MPFDGKTTTFRGLCQLAVALQRLFNPFCEVVIHNFADLEHSIVAIEGSVSKRSVGGAATDLMLAKVSSGDTDEDLYSYLTSLPGGKLLKSSTVFLRDDSGKAYGAICINFDITQFVSFRQILGALTSANDRNGVTEMLSDDIQNIIEATIAELLQDRGENLFIMTREDKIDLVARLNSKGIFQFKRGVPLVADLLGLSRATVYNYLRSPKQSREK
jgi:predicted transcriptional regulator YheO